MATKRVASKGGKARAAIMTPEERSESARKAARARWGDRGTRGMLEATHAGDLVLGEISLSCAVLEDGRRVLSERGFYAGLTGGSRHSTKHDSDNEVPSFLSAKSLKPFISGSLSVALRDRVSYKLPKVLGVRGGGGVAHGIEAILIPDICEVYLKARDAGALHYTQEPIAARAETLVRGLAKVGIVALVDEATGYQDDRTRDDQHKPGPDGFLPTVY